ncbi:kismet isoform c [Anaeramoeba flamelloides]|uniref:Kismet isoform c n=1 Tax=Anaeramoeba flamelloides TaxID=1746091 RepID=A0AAV8A117_9EUKA|nr:kismet isoform c [Anaeramoeba flamelloides]
MSIDLKNKNQNLETEEVQDNEKESFSQDQKKDMEEIKEQNEEESEEIEKKDKEGKNKTSKKKGKQSSSSENESSSEEEEEEEEDSEDDDDDEDDDDPKNYCCGKNLPDEVWVECENSKCKKKWFHLGCVGLDKVPEEKWYCEDCQSQETSDEEESSEEESSEEESEESSEEESSDESSEEESSGAEEFVPYCPSRMKKEVIPDKASRNSKRLKKKKKFDFKESSTTQSSEEEIESEESLSNSSSSENEGTLNSKNIEKILLKRDPGEKIINEKYDPQTNKSPRKRKNRFSLGNLQVKKLDFMGNEKEITKEETNIKEKEKQKDMEVIENNEEKEKEKEKEKKVTNENSKTKEGEVTEKMNHLTLNKEKEEEEKKKEKGKKNKKTDKKNQDSSFESLSGSEDNTKEGNQESEEESEEEEEESEEEESEEEESEEEESQEEEGPIADSESSDEDEPQYLVKFKGESYLHLKWVPESFILEQTSGKQRLNRFNNKVWPEMTEENKKIPFDPNFVEVERIIDWDDPECQNVADDGDELSEKESETEEQKSERINNRKNRRSYYVKWKGLPYTESTWELEKDIDDDEKIMDFMKRENSYQIRLDAQKMWQKINDGEYQMWQQYDQSPIYKNDHTLRDYQVDGLNWLTFNWHQGRNSILADQMGLGKSIQTIAFFEYLRDEQLIWGPFLLVVPLSTLYNWEREFSNWSDLNCVVYHGRPEELKKIKEYEWFYDEQTVPTRNTPRSSVWYNFFKFDVVVTTYETVLKDKKTFRRIEWASIVYDEAHKLKNHNSKIYKELYDLDATSMVLLTGTPLQNSLDELWSMLHFLDQKEFKSQNAFLKEFGDMQDSTQVEKLHKILKPYLLRRLKEDVEKSIIPKEETIVEVELTRFQKQWYRAILQGNLDFLSSDSKKIKVPRLVNVVMQLRKVCNHPYSIQGAEDYAIQNIDEDDEEEIMRTLVMSSGKFVLLDKLLPKLQKQGSKVLIFSQMVTLLDIIEDYITWKEYKFERLDGSIRGNVRQQAIDRFNNPKFERFIFLLCTRAGGVGINLTSANTVIIFDSDWNPQNDIQAMDRCHRIGQTKKVNVYRLITRNTYEREMFDRASKKLGLDQAVLTNITGSKTNLSSGSNADLEDMLHNFIGGKQKEKKLNAKEINELLKYGAYNLFQDNDEDKKFCEEDIDQILDNRTKKITYDPLNKNNTTENDNKISSFSRATFVSEGADTSLDINDPNFWEKLMPEKFNAKNKKKLAEKRRLQKMGNRITRNASKKYGKNSYFIKKNNYQTTQFKKLKEYDPDCWYKSETKRLIGKGLFAFGFSDRWGAIERRSQIKRFTSDEIRNFSILLLKLLLMTTPSDDLTERYPLLLYHLYKATTEQLEEEDSKYIANLVIPTKSKFESTYQKEKEQVLLKLKENKLQKKEINKIKKSLKEEEREKNKELKMKLRREKDLVKKNKKSIELQYFLQAEEERKKLESKDQDQNEDQEETDKREQIKEQESNRIKEKKELIKNILNNKIFSIDNKLKIKFHINENKIKNVKNMMLLNINQDEFNTIAKFISFECTRDYKKILKNPSLLDYPLLSQLDKNKENWLMILESLATLERVFKIFFVKSKLKSYDDSDDEDNLDSDDDGDDDDDDEEKKDKKKKGNKKKKKKKKPTLINIHDHHTDLIETDIINNINTLMIPVVSLKTLPSKKWNEDNDRMLLYGIFKHGWEEFNLIKSDPTLGFNEFLPKKEILETISTLKNEFEENNKKKKKSQKKKLKSKLDKEIEELENKIWPRVSKLKLRINSLINAYRQSNFLLDDDISDKNVKKRKIFFNSNSTQNGIHAQENKTKWTKKLSSSFYRALLRYGCPLTDNGETDYKRIHSLVGDTNRKVSHIKTLYHQYYNECKRLARGLERSKKSKNESSDHEEDESQKDKKIKAVPGLTIAPNSAKRVFERIEMMEYIETVIFNSDNMNSIFKKIRTQKNLPDRWKNQTHDIDLLVGCQKHGFEMEEIVNDQELSLYKLKKRILSKIQKRKEKKKNKQDDEANSDDEEDNDGEEKDEDSNEDDEDSDNDKANEKEKEKEEKKKKTNKIPGFPSNIQLYNRVKFLITNFEQIQKKNLEKMEKKKNKKSKKNTKNSKNTKKQKNKKSKSTNKKKSKSTNKKKKKKK